MFCAMDVRIEPSWKKALEAEWGKPYFIALTDAVRRAYADAAAHGGHIYPPGRDIFRAFDLCPFDKVKVVILGQDPYHGAGQANGLAFSVGPGIPPPPSLVNIFKEIESATGKPSQVKDGDLSFWARQGVLLLNATLTVSEGRAGSHQGLGWETFTDAVIRALSQHREHIVYILWGSYAISKGREIDRSRNLVLTSPHPSPLSAYRGFFGSRPFTKANAYLIDHGETPIIW